MIGNFRSDQCSELVRSLSSQVHALSLPIGISFFTKIVRKFFDLSRSVTELVRSITELTRSVT